MRTSFFRVIIPTHNNADTIARAVRSVTTQEFKDFCLVVVNDASTDDTAKELDKLEIDYRLDLPAQRFNGGARNAGMKLGDPSEYTLFLDGDDDWVSPRFLGKLHEFIIAKGFPDIVRLPYIRNEVDGKKIDQTPNIQRLEHSLADTAKNCRVACWTKAVRTSKLQPFPENTLMEDVCQHLRQCDVAETIEWFPEPVTNWRIRLKSTSNARSAKWKSSAYRFVADLMDLELTKDYTKARRDEKIREAVNNLKRGIYEQ